MQLVGIPPEHADQVWPMVAGWLAAALKRDGRFRLEDVLERVRDARAQLWVVWGEGKAWAAVVTEVCAYPLAKELNIWLCGGSDRKRWTPMVLEDLDEYARASGCNRVTAAGRRGWGDDMPGFAQKLVIYLKELR